MLELDFGIVLERLGRVCYDESIRSAKQRSKDGATGTVPLFGRHREQSRNIGKRTALAIVQTIVLT